MPHTQTMKDELEQLCFDNTEEGKQAEAYEVRAYFNYPEYYRPFRIRFLDYCNEQAGEELSAEELWHKLRKKAGTTLNRNTLANWLGVERQQKSETPQKLHEGPKHGEAGRENLFKVGFALEYTPEQMAGLLEKVYLERGFNRRNYKEVVYYYCLKNRKSYQEACRILEHLEEPMKSASGENHMESTMIQRVTGEVEDEDEFIAVLIEHAGEFCVSNTAAKREMDALYGKVFEVMNKSNVLPNSLKEGKDQYKRGTILMKILGEEELRSKETRNLFMMRHGKTKIQFPMEMKNEFPSIDNLFIKDPDAYVLRKRLILLAFYWYFGSIENERSLDNYDEFQKNVDNLLDRCGYPRLYVSNPYDWLFLFCAYFGLLQEDGVCEPGTKYLVSGPLNVLREILCSEDD